MTIFETIDDIAKCVTTRAGRVFLISHVSRIGISAFCAAIEWYWYPPNTSRNRFFDVYAANWHGMKWIIIALPIGRLPATQRLAKQLGLRIADGSPVIMGDQRSQVIVQATLRPSKIDAVLKETPMAFFPGTLLPNGQENEFIYTVENDHGSPVYKNRRNDAETISQASGEINDMLNKGIKLTPAQIADYIYGTGPFPNA
jgi:hypothetical protein